MRNESIIFIAIFALAAVLRLGDLGQGESDFVPSGASGVEAYYHFHPDEETLVRGVGSSWAVLRWAARSRW
jgi:hypothetical protein